MITNAKQMNVVMQMMAGWTPGILSFCQLLRSELKGFSALRVIKRRRDRAGQGFGTHPHKDMEILTYVLEGTVEHQDSMGNKEQVPAVVPDYECGYGYSSLQRQPSSTECWHLYQIRITLRKWYYAAL
ncbi:pirin family protein [Shigella flexneri]